MSQSVQKSANAYFKRYFRRFVISLLLVMLTVVLGTLGFMFVSGYSFSEAYYMTIITLSSVGYGEVKPLDDSGRLLASLLILVNIGIFAYALASLSGFVIEGELKDYLKYKNMNQRISKLRNHTIVCGFGRHGQQIVEELEKRHAEFVVIEPQSDKIALLQAQGHLYLEGDATNDDLLRTAGIERARCIAVTFGEDAFNVYTVLSARQLNPHIRIVSRASDAHAEEKLRRAGADHTVRSERIGGFYMATLLQQPHLVEFFNLLSNMGESGGIHFREVRYEQLREEFRDRPLRELHLRAQTGATIIGLRQPPDTYRINPSLDVQVHKGMDLIVLGDLKQIHAFEALVLQKA